MIIQLLVPCDVCVASGILVLDVHDDVFVVVDVRMHAYGVNASWALVAGSAVAITYKGLLTVDTISTLFEVTYERFAHANGDILGYAQRRSCVSSSQTRALPVALERGSIACLVAAACPA